MPAPPPDSKPEYYRPFRGGFQPRFTIGIVYLFGFFFLFCALLIAPSMIEILREVPTGPAQQEAAERIGREVIQPRLLFAVLLSALTTILGAHYRLLPGFRNVR